MEMKKSSKRAGIVVVIASLAVALAPSVASAAETGWLLNNMCYFGTVGVTKYTTVNSSQKVTAYEDGTYSGNIGLRVRYGSTTSSYAWGATYSSWTIGSGIGSFNVYH